MKLAVCCLPLNEKQKERLTSVPGEWGFCFRNHAAEITDEDLSCAQAIIGNVPPARLAGCRQLELLQLNSAGTDGYTIPGVLPEGAALANASGAYGLAISEYMLAGVLTLIKKLPLYEAHKPEQIWKSEGKVRSIWNSRTLVIGCGNIGGEFASRMRALGSYVVGLRRTEGDKPDYVDEIYTMDHLDEELGKADFVACSLPGTPATVRLFDRTRFEQMKNDAIFINVGRGTLTDPEVLAAVLKEGVIGGAVIDVTDPEPLPAESGLWTAPNLVLTPHVSGGFSLPETLNRIVEIAVRNLTHLTKGEPIDNLVDVSTGYRIREGRHDHF